MLKDKRVISFSTNQLTRMYLDKIEADIRADARDGGGVCVGMTALMTRIVSGYFVMRYGDDARIKIRKAFYEKTFNEIDGNINQMSKHNAQISSEDI